MRPQANPLNAPSFGSTSRSTASAWAEQHQRLLTESTALLRKKQADEVAASWERTELEIYYVLDLPESRARNKPVIWFHTQDKSLTGRHHSIRPTQMSWREVRDAADPRDREILSFLVNEECGLSGIRTAIVTRASEYRLGNSCYPAPPFFMTYEKATLPDRNPGRLLQLLAETGRFIQFCEDPNDKSGKSVIRRTIKWDEGPAWKLKIQMDLSGESYVFRGKLARDAEEVDLQDALLCLKSGIVLFPDRIASLGSTSHFPWLVALRDQKLAPVPASEMPLWLETFAKDPHSPWFELPELPGWRKERLKPLPRMVFARSIKVRPEALRTFALTAELRFVYGDHEVSALSSSSIIVDAATRTLILRDRAQEDAWVRQARSLKGVHPYWRDDISDPLESPFWRVTTADFPRVVSELLNWGWKVEAHGKRVRSGAGFSMKVSTGIDWFGLQGEADFGDQQLARVPELIAAMENGEDLIPLGDGTFGLLPEVWLKKVAPLTQIGERTSDGLRFRRAQGILLSAWLAEAELLRATDADFSRLTEQISGLTDLKPCLPPPSFRGELRSYQQEGLAWLKYLRQAGLGGILADDMGLGKTVQVLAHLVAEHREHQPSVGPSLIVLPKTILFNWQEEAAKFTPELKVVAYAGTSSERASRWKAIQGADIVLTTYPVLRQDIELLRTLDFHYIITDEANAIKNRESQTHRASLLLRGRHRLALTGTPVENSVDDLFALLDFVMPGLIHQKLRERFTCRKSTLKTLQSTTADEVGKPEADHELLRQLARALKPFILRRTKAQVLSELPEKSEETLYCELSPTEMRQYRELRDYYRKHLRNEIDRQGLGRSKIIVLEALLRLRQAACHPGLIDSKRQASGSAKLEILMERLQELIAEGHKALIFSQFTSFLDLVEPALKSENIRYERLDGQTGGAERQAAVARFQEDDSARVFLLSVKAGGIGLNLTSADYVFLLDPWWNPAVESQAIDRTHRIGQKSKVTAYRLIARGTVEERILELQRTKKDLAEVLVSVDANLLRNLTPEDIEILLS